MTTPHTADEPKRRRRGTFAIAVASAAAAAGTSLVAGPARLMGWSLSGGSQSGNATGTVTSPGAAANIAITGTLPQGRYVVTVYVSLAGTLAQGADAKNLQLVIIGGAPNIVLDNTIAAGQQTFGPFDIEITAAGGGTVAVQTIGAGTVGSIYTAEVAANQDAEGTINDAGQVIAVWDTPDGGTSTQWLGEDGVYIGSTATVSVTQGDVSGCIWVRKYDDYC